MGRALLLTCLLATPSVAQVGGDVNPYNPYTNLTVGGPISFRSYSSLDRLNVQHQYGVTSSGYFALRSATSTLTTSSVRAAGFRYYPNYPALNSPPSGFGDAGYSAAVVKQPLPLTAPLPAEIGCDPYLDDDGCLSEIAGW